MLFWLITLHWKVFSVTPLEFLFIYSRNLDKRLKWLSFSPVFTLSLPHIGWIIFPLCGGLNWQETMLLYVRRSNRLMGGHGSAKLTIKGQAVIHGAITSRAASDLLTTTWRRWHVSVLFFWQVHISLMDWHHGKIFHRDPNILCNHPYCEKWLCRLHKLVLIPCIWFTLNDRVRRSNANFSYVHVEINSVYYN